MFCTCNAENVYLIITTKLCSILYTVFNGTSAGLGGILCAGLVVSSWIAYEIFECPERCMMNEVACYLYAYRARWLATGSAKGSSSKWNSAPGQYIIKRNVCIRNLQAFSRCGQGAWRVWGMGLGMVEGKKRVGGWVCWMGEEEAKGSSRFCWISSIFILADLCLLTISLQLENESTRANFTVRAHWTKPPTVCGKRC